MLRIYKSYFLQGFTLHKVEKYISNKNSEAGNSEKKPIIFTFTFSSFLIIHGSFYLLYHLLHLLFSLYFFILFSLFLTFFSSQSTPKLRGQISMLDSYLYTFPVMEFCQTQVIRGSTDSTWLLSFINLVCNIIIYFLNFSMTVVKTGVA